MSSLLMFVLFFELNIGILDWNMLRNAYIDSVCSYIVLENISSTCFMPIHYFSYLCSMKYKNIIFDLGNVLVKLDEAATLKAFAELGLDHFDHIRENPDTLALFQAMGVGRISNQTFFDGFRKTSSSQASDQQITDAANAMLTYIPDEKKKRLLELRKAGHRVFLLSNTIDLHWQYIKDHLFPMDHYVADDFYEHAFLSQEMHMKKPDDEIFLTVISETGINPDETLFIDDLEVNCIAAERNGIHTFQNKEFNDWMKLDL